MGVIREIHSAYGVTLKGEIQEYTWYDGKVDDVIYTIWVNEREIYLGYSFFIILSDPSGQRINMEADKDVLCWYLAHNPMNDQELEDFFLKQYHHTLWKYHARNEMFKEKQEAEEKKRAEMRRERREAELAAIKAYAEKKNYYMVRDYDSIYLIKLDKQRREEVENGNVADDVVLRFAKECPGHGCDIVERKILTA